MRRGATFAQRVCAAILGLLIAACSAGTGSGSTSTSSTAERSTDGIDTSVGPIAANDSTAVPAGSSTTLAAVVPSSTSLPESPVTIAERPDLPCAPPATAPDSTAPIVLQLWSDLSPETEKILAEQILQFNGSGRGIEIVLTHTGSSDGTVQRLGNEPPPDLLVLGVEGLINLTDSGIVTKAQTCMANDPGVDVADLLPIAASTYQLRGQQIAMPLTVSTPVLYYDRDLFLRAGLDPDKPPQTLVELRSALRVLIKTEGVSQGLVYGDPRWFINQWAAQLGVSLATGSNGHDVPDGTGTRLSLDDSRLIGALDTLQSMSAEGLIGAPTRDFDDLAALISGSGRASMAFHTSGSASLVYDIIEKAPQLGSVGMAPLPGPGAGGLVGGAAMWITTPDPGKAWAAWIATRFFTDQAQQVRYAELGYAPARVSAASDPELLAVWATRPGLRVAFDQLNSMSSDGSHLAVAAGTETNISWRLDWAASDIITKQADPAQTLARAEADINGWLSTYNGIRYGAP